MVLFGKGGIDVCGYLFSFLISITFLLAIAFPMRVLSEPMCDSAALAEFRVALISSAKSGDYREVYSPEIKIRGQKCPPEELVEILEDAGFTASIYDFDGQRAIVSGVIKDHSFVRWLFSNSLAANAYIEFLDGVISNTSIGPKK